MISFTFNCNDKQHQSQQRFWCIFVKSSHIVASLLLTKGDWASCSERHFSQGGWNKKRAKVITITDNTFHPLHEMLRVFCSYFSNLLLNPQCRKQWYHRSFIPAAVGMTSVDCHTYNWSIYQPHCPCYNCIEQCFDFCTCTYC